MKVSELLNESDLDNLAIGTLGSLSSLNIFKGAKEEEFKTVRVCKKNNVIFYTKFPLANEIIIVRDFIARAIQRDWLLRVGLKPPKTFGKAEEINRLAIAKLPDAKGGSARESWGIR